MHSVWLFRISEFIRNKPNMVKEYPKNFWVQQRADNVGYSRDIVYANVVPGVPGEGVVPLGDVGCVDRLVGGDMLPASLSAQSYSPSQTSPRTWST